MPSYEAEFSICSAAATTADADADIDAGVGEASDETLVDGCPGDFGFAIMAPGPFRR
jgi:hypothetical protein